MERLSDLLKVSEWPNGLLSFLIPDLEKFVFHQEINIGHVIPFDSMAEKNGHKEGQIVFYSRSCCSIGAYHLPSLKMCMVPPTRSSNSDGISQVEM